MVRYKLQRKIFRLGKPGSLVISLPKIWVDAHGLKAGQTLTAEFDGFKGLLLVPVEDQMPTQPEIEGRQIEPVGE